MNLTSPGRQRKGQGVFRERKLTGQSNAKWKSVKGLRNGIFDCGEKEGCAMEPGEAGGRSQLVESLEDQAQVVALGNWQLPKAAEHGEVGREHD